MMTNENNPYAAPAESPAPYLIETTGVQQPASQGKRFVNLLLDNVIMIVGNNIICFAVGLTIGVVRATQGNPITEADVPLLNVIGFGVSLLCSVIYLTFFEALFQRTPGKFVTGTKVVNMDGGKPTLGQIFGRTFSRFIPFEAFSFFGGNGYPVGWHDSLSGTRVIEIAKSR